MDMDGVIRHWENLPGVDDALGLEPGTFAAIAVGEDSVRRANDGTLTHHEWRDEVAARLAEGHGCDPAAVLTAWRDDAFEVDPAWTPRPVEGNVPAWERATDKDWIDGRFRLTDTGPFLDATVAYPSWQGIVHHPGTRILPQKKGPRGAIPEARSDPRSPGWRITSSPGRWNRCGRRTRPSGRTPPRRSGSEPWSARCR